MSDKRTAEEWGRVAVSLPGWRWMPGMRSNFNARSVGDDLWLDRDDLRGSVIYADPDDGEVPDPDDPATAGCLLALLGPYADEVVYDCGMWTYGVAFDTLGRACIAAAEALGRWPGGAP